MKKGILHTISIGLIFWIAILQNFAMTEKPNECDTLFSFFHTSAKSLSSDSKHLISTSVSVFYEKVVLSEPEEKEEEILSIKTFSGFSEYDCTPLCLQRLGDYFHFVQRLLFFNKSNFTISSFKSLFLKLRVFRI